MPEADVVYYGAGDFVLVEVGDAVGGHPGMGGAVLAVAGEAVGDDRGAAHVTVWHNDLSKVQRMHPCRRIEYDRSPGT